MDRNLLAACLSTATQIVANTGKMINMHHAGAKDVVVDAALTLYDELEEIIAQREAAAKALEEEEFAKLAAERAEAERDEAERVASEEAPAASDLPGAEERREGV